MWMYVLVAFFFCTFRRCFFLVVRVHTFRIYLIRYQKADMHKIHTEPDDSAVHFIHASLNRHLSLSIACAPSTSISFGRSFVRLWLIRFACHCRKRSMFTFATATVAPAFVSIEEHIEHFEFGFSCDWDTEPIKRAFESIGRTSHRYTIFFYSLFLSIFNKKKIEPHQPNSRPNQATYRSRLTNNREL